MSHRLRPRLTLSANFTRRETQQPSALKLNQQRSGHSQAYF